MEFKNIKSAVVRTVKVVSTTALLLGATSIFSAHAQSEVIGEYANGCVKGAVPLKSGTNYQVQVWGAGRNFGHPQLIDYIQKLVMKAKAHHLPDLLIGDLSRYNGGSFGASSSHGSHQSGLDVDISFDFATPRKTAYELSHPKDVYLVDGQNRKTSNFTNERVALIYLAASDSRVERIFVAPGIKKTLCDVYQGHDRSWLQKIRPWYGHRGHMHVRLGCPLDSPLCVKQAVAPKGDGCGDELESWLHPKEWAKAHPQPKNAKPTPRKKRVMYPQFRELLVTRR